MQSEVGLLNNLMLRFDSLSLSEFAFAFYVSILCQYTFGKRETVLNFYPHVSAAIPSDKICVCIESASSLNSAATLMAVNLDVCLPLL